MTLKNRYLEIRHGFSSTFWIANTLELFERLAFYGSKAVLTMYLAKKVGLEDEAGTLAGTFSFLIFMLPIFAGVFVDRYGFKRALMACFFIFCIGYFLIGLAGLEYGQSIMEVVGRRPYILGVLTLTAIGGSLIKPCIVGTVAVTSRKETKALGFSIYYTLANFGGAIGPILAMQVRQNLGIEYVLLMSSFTSFLLFFGAWLFYRDPQTAETNMPRKTVLQVLLDFLQVIRNFRFMSFLIIFSGFWLMFWQVFYLVPFYGTEVLHFEDFELLETVDAVCIIVITIPITALVQRWKPIHAITLGLVVSSVSWIVIGSSATLTATVVGIALFALGESIQSPRFYEYVASLAPKGQMGTFMGFAFLPVAIGSLGAGIVSDWLRNTYMNMQDAPQSYDPQFMWYALSGVGLAATVLMLLYNALLAPKASVAQQ